jgi:hypothetical protein
MENSKSVTLAHLNFYPKEGDNVSTSPRFTRRERGILLTLRTAVCFLFVGAVDVSLSCFATEGVVHGEKSDRVDFRESRLLQNGRSADKEIANKRLVPTKRPTG